MKIKSAKHKNIFFEKWITPVTNAKFLWLDGIIQTGRGVHFFFRIGEALSNNFHVMSIWRGYPYRVMDETEASYYIGEYIVPKFKKHKAKNLSGFYLRSWKLWGTPFSQDSNSIGRLSDYDYSQKKNVIEYLICTDDEWIECISPLPTWKSYKGIKLETLIMKHLKGKLPETIKRSYE